MGDLPSGTVTFLFTDVEGSTRLWAADPDAMAASLRVHDDLMRESIESHGGYVFTTAGDAFCAAFDKASDAVASAQDAQSRLADTSWSGPALRVRMGLHLGEADERGGDYFGPTVNTAARVESAGHGGQVLVTEAVRAAARIESVDLGVHRLRDVVEPVALFQVGEGKFPALRVVPETLSSLPIPATTLVGREDEIRRVRTMLLDHQLVTLTGVGGSGKTRLAIEIAERELPKLAHGAYFADLSQVSDDDGVIAAVLSAVRLQAGSGDPLDRLLSHLRDKQVLVILDNCEHVIDACAEFAEACLTSGGAWRLLATSREHLDVEGEQVIQTPSLSVADRGPAVRLFADRASLNDPDFVLDAQTETAVAELCERLDGMPLAIELAAARIGVMSAEEMLERIGDRFRLLSGGRRRHRQRQRTLEATLDWSYDLLDTSEQEFLRSLGVFVGPFDTGAAAGVGAVGVPEATDLLESLGAKSLVQSRRTAGRTLFWLLETVRAYTEDHLLRHDELKTARDRHLEHHHRSIESGFDFDPWIARGSTLAAIRRWHPMKANLGAAMRWAISTERQPAAGEMLWRASPVWGIDTGAESAGQVAALLEDVSASDLDDSLRQRLLSVEAWVAQTFNDVDRLAEALTAMSGSPDRDVRILGLAWRAMVLAVTDGTRAVELYEAIDEGAAGELLSYYEPFIRLSAGQFELARYQFEQPTDVSHLPHAAVALAVCLLWTDEPEAALEAVEAAYSQDDWERFAGSGPLPLAGGVARLALGDRESGERELLPYARWCLLDRVWRAPNQGLIGLAALEHNVGNDERAAELILASGRNSTPITRGLARYVAYTIGVSDEMAAEEAAFTNFDGSEALRVLNDALARWDT